MLRQAFHVAWVVALALIALPLAAQTREAGSYPVTPIRFLDMVTFFIGGTFT